MNATEKLNTVAKLAEAKSKQDIQAALEIYSSDIELISPSFNSHVQGPTKAGQQLAIFFALFPDYSVELEQYAVNDEVLLSTGSVRVTPNIPNKSCPQVEVPVAIEFHFQGSRISKEVFYLDAGLVCRHAGIGHEDLIHATQFHIKNLF